MSKRATNNLNATSNIDTTPLDTFGGEVLTPQTQSNYGCIAECC